MSRNVHFLCLAFKAIRQEDFIFVLTLIKTDNRNRCCLKKKWKGISTIKQQTLNQVFLLKLKRKGSLFRI